LIVKPAQVDIACHVGSDRNPVFRHAGEGRHPGIFVLKGGT
jgi:hypothetical protein